MVNKLLANHADKDGLSVAGSSADAPEVIRKAYNYLTRKIYCYNVHNALLDQDLVEDWIAQEGMVEKVSQLLAFVDTGVAGVRVGEDESKLAALKVFPENIREFLAPRVKRAYHFAHQTETNEITQFDMEQISHGTRKLFRMAPLLIHVLENGGVVVIDELDNGMHPFMVELLIKLFHGPAVNRNGTQLIFTTHNVNLMTAERFRRDQIWLTEKRQGATHLYSLDEFDKKKVTPQCPFNRWYIDGRFGAVPSIDYRGVIGIFAQGQGASEAKK